MAERVPPGVWTTSDEEAAKPTRSAVGFTVALLRDHASWAVDRTSGAGLPRGWQALVRALFAGMELGMADAPAARVEVTSVEAVDGRLRVAFNDDAARPTPPEVLLALAAMVAEAGRVASETCRRCGRDLGPGAGGDGRLAAHRASNPDCRPTRTMAAILAAIDACEHPRGDRGVAAVQEVSGGEHTCAGT